MLRWHLALLVSVAIAISYLDRQTLPVAIGEIQREIPISNSVKARLDSAFLLTYGLMYVGGGRLMDVLGTKRGFLLIMVFWSLAVGTVAGFVGLGGALDGVVLGQLAGWLLDHGFSYPPVLVIAGSLHVAAFLLILATVRSLQPLPLKPQYQAA